jgi:PAS domain S-box-containing protein
VEPEGTEREMRLDFVYAPIIDADGRVGGIFFEGHDVTETYAVQHALAEREEQLRLATEAAEVGLWDVDIASGTVFWPPRVRAMFGIGTDEPVMLPDFFAVLHPDDRERAAAAFAAACDPQRRALYDVEYRTLGRDDGVVRWVAAKGRAIFDADGRCVRVLGTALDVSARKAAEAQLRESEERLRESDRRKDEFLATLAHELRNPLAPLRNALHLQRLQGETGRLHAMMDRQVNQLVRLVDDLLEISRISRGTLELRTERVDLAASVRAAVEACTPLITQRGHDLRLELPSEPVWVDGDPVRLTQIASNLVNNAALYTPPGGHIEVGVAAAHGFAHMRISDTGEGFAPGELPKLYEMFRRGPGSSGLGIGLALSQRLALLHGGTLEGESPGPGQGATFTCTLPLAPAPPAAAPRVAHGGLDMLRILVVDDNRDAAESLELVLRHLGAQVRVAYCGREALDCVDEEMPAVVLLDIGMPEMNGYEVARELRSRHGAALRLVALSGWGQEVDRARGRAAGFDQHLIKPADIDTLRALLDEVVGSAGPVRRPLMTD